MGVGVDEAGEQQAAGHVHHLGIRVRLQLPANADDLLIFNQQVGPLHPGTGDHRAAFQQFFHRTPSISAARGRLTAMFGFYKYITIAFAFPVKTVKNWDT